MPCPTCDHTLSLLVTVEDTSYRQCERCGTVVIDNKATDDPFWPHVYTPKLVTRCQDYIPVYDEPVSNMLWHKLGIHEAINLPQDRPQPGDNL